MKFRALLFGKSRPRPEVVAERFELEDEIVAVEADAAGVDDVVGNFPKLGTAKGPIYDPTEALSLVKDLQAVFRLNAEWTGATQFQH